MTMRKILLNRTLNAETFETNPSDLRIRFEDGSIAKLNMPDFIPEEYKGLTEAEELLVSYCNDILNKAGMPSMTYDEAVYFFGPPSRPEPTAEELTKLSGYTIEKTVKSFKKETP
jgi:hypothetical protein